MPICTICGEDVEKVVKCKECFEKFCEGCGVHEKKLCYFCDNEDSSRESFDYDAASLRLDYDEIDGYGFN